MFNKYCFFFLSLFLGSIVQAQQVKISGIAKSYENEEIGLWVYRDFISKAERQVTYSTIDAEGNFLLEFNSSGIQYVTLKINKSVASLYVEPNSVYEIVINKMDSTTYLNPNIEQEVPLLIKLKSKTEINALTMDYDDRFDDFLTNEYQAFVLRNPRSKIDSFKIVMHAFYADVQNDYFNAYVTYSIAALEEKVKASKNKLYSSYLENKKIRYDHQEYFNFFNVFYKKYLRDFSLTVGDQMVTQINVKNSFEGAIELMKEAKYLSNDTIRELVFIKGLYESYYDGTFKKLSIVKVLEQVTDESKVDENRQIAQNIINSFSKLKPGELAPYFELPDKTGSTHSLDALRSNKAIYLFFFNQECTACLQQLKIANSMQEKYGKWIEFVGVSLNESMADFKTFCLKNPSYNCLLLYDNTSEKLKNEYEIRSLPAYFLIGMDGKFIQAPAESFEGEIERSFYDISKPKGRQHQVGDKDNRN